MVVFGYIAGDRFQKKMNEGPHEENILEEMTHALPYVQLQTIVLAIWLAYGVFIWRILQEK